MAANLPKCPLCGKSVVASSARFVWCQVWCQDSDCAYFVSLETHKALSAKLRAKPRPKGEVLASKVWIRPCSPLVLHACRPHRCRPIPEFPMCVECAGLPIEVEVRAVRGRAGK